MTTYVVSFEGEIKSSSLRIYTSIKDIYNSLEVFNKAPAWKESTVTNKALFHGVFRIAKVKEDHTIGRSTWAMFDKNKNIVKAKLKEIKPDEADWNQIGVTQYRGIPGKVLYTE